MKPSTRHVRYLAAASRAHLAISAPSPRRCPAARARIKSAENNYYPTGANIEFACELLPPAANSTDGARQRPDHAPLGGSSRPDQIYWYHNGNLLNYANTLDEPTRRDNLSIEWDRGAQLSRLKLSNIQTADSGNYTCKPPSAEPATVRLFVKSSYRAQQHHFQLRSTRFRLQHTASSAWTLTKQFNPSLEPLNRTTPGRQQGPLQRRQCVPSVEWARGATSAPAARRLCRGLVGAPEPKAALVPDVESHLGRPADSLLARSGATALGLEQLARCHCQCQGRARQATN